MARSQDGRVAPSRCRPGTAVVERLAIEGARAGDTESLLSVLSTVPSPRPRQWWLGRAAPTACVDTTELDRDALRLAVVHRERGWLEATARVRRSGVETLSATILVEPGPLYRVGDVAVRGLPPGSQAGAPLMALAGRPLDRIAIAVASDSVRGRLRDAGYARAAVAAAEVRVDSVARTGTVTAVVTPGPPIRIGEIRFAISRPAGARPALSAATLRSVVRLTPGAPLRDRDLLRAQRDLYQLDAYRLVFIDTVPVAGAAADSVLDLVVRLAEARTHLLRSGLGWATQECGRAQARYVDRTLTGRPLRLELTTRLGLIGAGEPLGQVRGLCAPVVRRDTVFSTQLNYYVGATLQTARTSRAVAAPSLTVYRERRSEVNAFIRNTALGALVELRVPSRTWPVTLGYSIESGNTLSEPAVQCARFGICELDDLVFSILGNAVQVASTSVLGDRTDRPLDPTRGWRTRLDLRAGSTFDIGRATGAELDLPAVPFSKATGELAGYLPLGRATTLAARMQLAGVAVARTSQLFGARFLPQQERLFAGGQSSVRGYLQNQLGPLVYLVDSVRTLQQDGAEFVEARPGARVVRVAPRGGTGLALANLELRRRVPLRRAPLQWVAFLDAGTLWERGADALRWRDVRVTPGLGVRVETPLGPFRLDAGYNPYPARAGRAYFVEGVGVPGDGVRRVLCASPGNRIDVTQPDPFADPAACPESYTPAAGRGRLARFAFHFSIGQAF